MRKVPVGGRIPVVTRPLPRRGYAPKVVGVGVLILILSTAIAFFAAWMGMIWLGVAHSFDERIPALGFWTTMFLGWALSALIMVPSTVRAARQ